MVQDCPHPEDKITRAEFCTTQQICDCFQMGSTSMVLSENKSYSMCANHQRQLRHFISKIKCKTCGQSYRTGMPQFKHCPNPDVISKYLNNNTDFTVAINADDKVCSVCYKSHLEILRNCAQSQFSTDHHLLESIGQVEKMLYAVVPTTEQDIVMMAALHTSREVGQYMLKDMPILLQDAYGIFLERLQQLQAQHSHISSFALHQPPQPKWLLASILGALQHHIKCTSKNKKYGTLLMRNSGGDPMNMLHGIMWQHRQQRLQLQEKIQLQKATIEELQSTTGMHAALAVVKEKIDAEVKQLNSVHLEHLHTLDEMDIEQEIRETDPTLWEMITILTQPKRLKNEGDAETQMKRFRRFYCLRNILYCTNSKRCTLQVLLTELLEAAGTSDVAISALNRFGAVASKDTHTRFLTSVAETVAERGGNYSTQCTKNAFCMVAVDNLDKNSPHSQVFCGDQSRGWHGISIQAVEPDPQNIKLFPDDYIQDANQPVPLSHLEVSPSTLGMLSTSFKGPSTLIRPPPSGFKGSSTLIRTPTSGFEGSSTPIRTPTSGFEGSSTLIRTPTSAFERSSTLIQTLPSDLDGPSALTQPTYHCEVPSPPSSLVRPSFGLEVPKRGPEMPSPANLMPSSSQEVMLCPGPEMPSPAHTMPTCTSNASNS